MTQRFHGRCRVLPIPGGLERGSLDFCTHAESHTGKHRQALAVRKQVTWDCHRAYHRSGMSYVLCKTTNSALTQSPHEAAWPVGSRSWSRAGGSPARGACRFVLSIVPLCVLLSPGAPCVWEYVCECVFCVCTHVCLSLCLSMCAHVFICVSVHVCLCTHVPMC